MVSWMDKLVSLTSDLVKGYIPANEEDDHTDPKHGTETTEDILEQLLCIVLTSSGKHVLAIGRETSRSVLGCQSQLGGR